MWYTVLVLIVVFWEANGLKAIECSSNRSICADPFCTLKPLRRGIQMMKIGCNPVTPSNNLWVRVTQYKKTNANRFLPGLYDFTADLCDMLRPKSMTHTFLEKFVDNIQPGMLEIYKKIFEQCPLKRPIRFEMEQNDLERTSFSNILGSGEYKTTIRIYNQKNETFYEMSTFYLFK